MTNFDKMQKALDVCREIGMNEASVAGVGVYWRRGEFDGMPSVTTNLPVHFNQPLAGCLCRFVRDGKHMGHHETVCNGVVFWSYDCCEEDAVDREFLIVEGMPLPDYTEAIQ